MANPEQTSVEFSGPEWGGLQALRQQIDVNEQQTLLMRLLASAPVAIVMVNGQGQILYANQRLCQMFGYSADELQGQMIELLIPERFRHAHVQHRSNFRRSPHTRPMGSGIELAGRHKDGSDFPIEAGLSYLQVGDELLVMGSISDITRRKQIEEELEHRVEERTREIERRRRVADGLRDILTALNSNQGQDEILNYIAAQACHLLAADASAICRGGEEPNSLFVQASYGLSRPAPHEEHAASGPGGLDVVSSEDQMQLSLRESDKGNVATVDPVDVDPVDTDYQAVLTVPLSLQDEAYGSLMLYYNEPRHFTGEEIELAKTVGDHTALAIANQRLRSQVERTAVAAERSRIARDLHDSVTQTLFSASLIAEVVPKLWRRNPEEAERRLDELRQLTRGALAEMRTLLLELRPATLMEVDLKELLRQLTEAITGRARMPIHLTVDAYTPLPPEVKVGIYHITQEALNNVAKHARATHASVHLQQVDGQTLLTIEDDGRGFIIEKVTPEHLGLSIMHERAAAIGAALDLHSRLGHGTTVTVRWPDKPQAGGR